jgi:hypothetical protein
MATTSRCKVVTHPHNQMGFAQRCCRLHSDILLCTQRTLVQLVVPHSPEHVLLLVAELPSPLSSGAAGGRNDDEDDDDDDDDDDNDDAMQGSHMSTVADFALPHLKLSTWRL